MLTHGHTMKQMYKEPNASPLSSLSKQTPKPATASYQQHPTAVHHSAPAALPSFRVDLVCAGPSRLLIKDHLKTSAVQKIPKGFGEARDMFVYVYDVSVFKAFPPQQSLQRSSTCDLKSLVTLTLIQGWLSTTPHHCWGHGSLSCQLVACRRSLCSLQKCWGPSTKMESGPSINHNADHNANLSNSIGLFIYTCVTQRYKPHHAMPHTQAPTHPSQQATSSIHFQNSSASQSASWHEEDFLRFTIRANEPEVPTDPSHLTSIQFIQNHSAICGSNM